MTDRLLLILDLDETLVYATEKPLAHQADFLVGPYHVYRRPHLDLFLATVKDWYRLAVWTSSTAPYAHGVVPHLFPDPSALAFVWARNHCTNRYDMELLEHSPSKDLRKLKCHGEKLERMLVLDDSPEKHRRNYGNLIRIRPFEGRSDDTELRDVLPFLDRLRTCENVRAVEKRNWRSQL